MVVRTQIINENILSETDEQYTLVVACGLAEDGRSFNVKAEVNLVNNNEHLCAVEFTGEIVNPIVIKSIIIHAATLYGACVASQMLKSFAKLGEIAKAESEKEKENLSLPERMRDTFDRFTKKTPEMKAATKKALLTCVETTKQNMLSGMLKVLLGKKDGERQLPPPSRPADNPGDDE